MFILNKPEKYFRVFQGQCQVSAQCFTLDQFGPVSTDLLSFKAHIAHAVRSFIHNLLILSSMNPPLSYLMIMVLIIP